MVSPITNKVIFMGTFTVDSLCLFFSLSAVYLLLQPSEKLLCAISDVDVQSTYGEVQLTYMMYEVSTSDFRLSHMMYVLTHYA